MCNNLALLYEEYGRYTEAEPLYLRALEASERTLGRDIPPRSSVSTTLPCSTKSRAGMLKQEPLNLRGSKPGAHIWERASTHARQRQ